MNTDNNQGIDDKVIIAITHGDLNGISYEIILKTLLDNRIMDFFTPVVYGSSKVASYHRKNLEINDFSLNLIKSVDQASAKRPNIVNCSNDEIKIDLGQSTEIAGQMSLMAIEKAIEDVKNGHFEILVTAPINKKNIQSKEFDFPGHTEYLANAFNCKDEVLMLMVSGNLRVGVVTGHIPHKDVSSVLTEELILNKITSLNKSLKSDFGIRSPKIAILGLNPHAGDKGVIGSEENDIIIPAIEKAIEKDMLVFGPFPADGFFGSSEYAKFDGILAMYHDQGLAPFKAMAFDSGVNFTAGLPIVRTSPAHGTAYEIAGKNIASPNAFREALFMAHTIYKNRSEYARLTANPLKTTELKNEK